jgi:transcriptional regulator with XRE-family HTH domain
MANLANLEIRQIINEKRLRQYEVAEAMKISEYTLSKWMRTEMPEDKKELVMQAINKLIGTK